MSNEEIEARFDQEVNEDIADMNTVLSEIVSLSQSHPELRDILGKGIQLLKAGVSEIQRLAPKDKKLIIKALESGQKENTDSNQDKPIDELEIDQKIERDIQKASVWEQYDKKELQQESNLLNRMLEEIQVIKQTLHDGTQTVEAAMLANNVKSFVGDFENSMKLGSSNKRIFRDMHHANRRLQEVKTLAQKKHNRILTIQQKPGLTPDIINDLNQEKQEILAQLKYLDQIAVMLKDVEEISILLKQAKDGNLGNSKIAKMFGENINVSNKSYKNETSIKREINTRISSIMDKAKSNGGMAPQNKVKELILVLNDLYILEHQKNELVKKGVVYLEWMIKLDSTILELNNRIKKVDGMTQKISRGTYKSTEAQLQRAA